MCWHLFVSNPHRFDKNYLPVIASNCGSLNPHRFDKNPPGPNLAVAKAGVSTLIGSIKTLLSRIRCLISNPIGSIKTVGISHAKIKFQTLIGSIKTLRPGFTCQSRECFKPSLGSIKTAFSYSEPKRAEVSNPHG